MSRLLPVLALLGKCAIVLLYAALVVAIVLLALAGWFG